MVMNRNFEVRGQGTRNVGGIKGGFYLGETYLGSSTLTSRVLIVVVIQTFTRRWRCQTSEAGSALW